MIGTRRGSWMRQVPLSMTLSATLSIGVAAAGTEEVVVRWRDGRPVDRGVLESIGPDGLRWRSPVGVSQSARWPEIREVDGLDERHRSLLEEGTVLWRAWSRLERGEVALATPLFVEMTERWHGEVSRRHRDALEGLLRCRIRDGRPVDAALAALELRELEIAAGEAAGGESMLARLPGGWPEEAPLWRIDPDGEEAARLRVGLRRFAESPVAGEAAWLEAAMLAGPPPAGTESSRSPAIAAPGGELLGIDETPPETLLADREDRLAAAATPAEERWIHARMATVFASDPDRDLRRRGLLEWLCIPARFPHSVEAPLALDAAARLAAALGDDDLAWRLARSADRAAQDLRSRPVPRTTP